MQKEYKTVLNFASVEYEEKKSRFIASVMPVSREEEALDFINGLRSRYWDATHNVFAYYIGGNSVTQRFSDDGEPSGTAGMPVLEVIKRMGLQDLAVVVTRYFGGTLLGAAGLIRAYSKSASLGVEAACIIKRRLCTEIGIMVEYNFFGKLQNFLMSREYTIKSVIYGQDVEIIVFVPVDDAEAFSEQVVETTNARALIDQGEKTYVTLDQNGKILL